MFKNIYTARILKTTFTICVIFSLLCFIKYGNDFRTITESMYTYTKHYVTFSRKIDNCKVPEYIYDHCSPNNTQLKMGKKVLSYTLYRKWGKDPTFSKFMGMLAKEALLSPLYNDWYLRLYHDETLPMSSRINLTQTFKNIELCDIRTIPCYGDLSGISGREWRFLPIGDKTVDIMCSRDIDTPLLPREDDAVKEWLLSNKAFHAMRDHPQHNDWHILAGMFCFRNTKNRTLTKLVFESIQNNHYHKNETFEPFKVSDQTLLREHVLPLVKNDMMQHDSFNCKRFPGSLPYPSKRLTNSSGFMGCKRPCPRIVPECPKECRPAKHKDWVFC